MKAASREAQSHVTDTLDELIRNADNTVAVAAQIGTELFLVVDQLDAERALREELFDEAERAIDARRRVRPDIDQLRPISARVGMAVAQQASQEGLAQKDLDNPVDTIFQTMWRPEYPRIEVI